MLGDMLMDKSMLLPNVGKVCRSLFGPVDHDEVKKTLQRELRVFEERSRDRWNFDFKQEQPLPGRYEYKRVTDVPAAYRMPQISLKVDVIRAYRQQEHTGQEEAQGVRVAVPAAPRLTPAAAGVGEAAPPQEEAVCVVQEVCVPCVQDCQPSPKADLPTPPQQTCTAAATTQTSPQKRKRQTEITDFYPQKKVARTEDSKSSS